jgi:hypothetical protein
MGKKWQYTGTVHQLFMNFKTDCDPVRREILYNILIDLGNIHETSWAIKIYLNKIHREGGMQ